MIGYEELISSVSRRTGIDTDQARTAAEATLAVLSVSVDEEAHRRLLDAVPASVRPHPAADRTPPSAPNAEEFSAAVARLSGTTAEQARQRAQAVLATLADREPELIEALSLPGDLPELCRDPASGTGRRRAPATRLTATPLTQEEITVLLPRLPGWSGDTRSLHREVNLPEPDLDRVLARITRLHQGTGSGPQVLRRSPESAVLTLRTESVDAVTALDVDLAVQLDQTIRDASEGLA